MSSSNGTSTLESTAAEVAVIRAELQELRDKDYIRERMDLYAFLLDAARWKDIAQEIFTDDAVDFHLPESNPPRTPRGREELAAFFDEVMVDFAGTQHMMGNYSVQVSGDEATSRTYALCAHWLEDSSSKPADWTVAICYDDKWRRTPDGWRVYERRLHPFGPSGIASGTAPNNQTRVGADLYGSRDR
jgi:SnoaL-like domain